MNKFNHQVERHDAYDNLFELIARDTFFKKSLESIIYSEAEKIDSAWKSLKDSVLNNKKVYIRGYGRNAARSKHYIELYKILFKNTNIHIDPTNNAEPTKLISSLTAYSKTSKKNKTHILNYQISHLFGRTKNPFLFCSPWNIAYIPKYLDPFTGHETQGSHSKDFKNIFNLILKEKFNLYLEDYNKIFSEFIQPNLESALYTTRNNFESSEKFDDFVTDCKNELSSICTD